MSNLYTFSMFEPQTSTSIQESALSNKSLRELQSGNRTDPVQRLRLLCLSRGGTGILELGRMFRRMYNSGNKNINFDEFFRGLRKTGLEITDEEAKEVFDMFDNDGHIDLDEFLIHMRPPLNESRQKIIEEAFHKMDKSDEGEITLEVLKRTYNVKSQPRYISGEESEEKILQLFLDNFEHDATKDGKITREEFFNYYAAISASIDNDCYFNLMMRQAYKL